MYDIYSPFDFEQHKNTYINYLEVIIYPDGHIEYSIPSHQEKLIEIACKMRNISRNELKQKCPRKYWYDFMTWLCNETYCIAVWNESIIKSDTYPITAFQIDTLFKLKSYGLYKGEL